MINLSGKQRRSDITRQINWEFNEKKSLPVSKLTIKIKWPRIHVKIASIIRKIYLEKKRKIDLLDIGAYKRGTFNLVQDVILHYVGIEPSYKILKQSTIPNNLGIMIQAFGEFIPCKNEKFDLVLLLSTLDHCFDPHRVISEAFRTLNSNGKLLISLTNESAWYKLLLKNYSKKRRAICSEHNFYFSTQIIEKLLEEKHFKIDEIYFFDYLRLPVFCENILERLIPEKILFWVLAKIDKIGSFILPARGGTFICVAKKDDRVKLEVSLN